jgi:dihydroorotate dehydrogenase
VLLRIDAERAHGLGTRLLRLAPLARRWLAPSDPVLRTHVLGLELPSPLVLAAGFDKDAAHVDGLLALGFGAVEIGTVTGLAQPGNPRPRLFRLPADRALVNRMGFNNAGAETVAARLQARAAVRGSGGGGGVVGVNIGKSKVVPSEEAASDYRASAAHLAPLADDLVIIVSSPNSPGLRELQATAQLRPLIAAVREAATDAGRADLPLLVKIAPDLADEDVDAVADLALETGLQGIIATNTTIARHGLRSDAAAIDRAGAGGLSGAPLAPRAEAVLRRLRARVGDRLVLVSAGGVTSAADVLARLRAGASMVQAYTGFVYGGPLWAARVNRDLSAQMRAEGIASVADLVGEGPIGSR